jgi:hypothetical protein
MKNQTQALGPVQDLALMITQNLDQALVQAVAQVVAQTLMSRAVVLEVTMKVALMMVAMKNQLLLHPLINKSSQVSEISTLT